MPIWDIWQHNYDSKAGNVIRNLLFGRDHNLSEQEYIDKHGYARPNTSAGILDLMSPNSAGKLLKAADEIKTAERVARTAKQAKSLEQSQRTQQAINNAGTTRISKTGRIHLINKSGPVASSNLNKTANTVSQTSDELEAYKNAVISANNALEMGNVDLASQFFRDADKFNPDLHNMFRKDGGIISAKSGIHIKKANKGKFTDYCGGKVTNECIQRGKHSSNPKIRRRATFAANARRWKHSQGGIITPSWLIFMMYHII